MPLAQVEQIFFKSLPQITGGVLLQSAFQGILGDIITDSRKANPTVNSVFFAISGPRHDGHKFLDELYHRGCRQFVVEKAVNLTAYPDCNILRVESALRAIQTVARIHRQAFRYPVIGITGSNGKTIVKEWLYHLLVPDHSIVKNPGSYNSQLGVPLSVWQMAAHHTVGIFEAGISKSGEMMLLADIIQPTLGVFTNVLAAHDEGFASRKEKAEDKAKLFRSCVAVVYCQDHALVDEALRLAQHPNQKYFSWGISLEADLVVSATASGFQLKNKTITIQVNRIFPDAASRENLFHCIAVMVYLGYTAEVIETRINLLRTLPMRLEMKEGQNDSKIIDDSYSNDLAGLKIALDFLGSQRTGKKIVFLSDLVESGLADKEWTEKVNQLLTQHHIDSLVAIGPGFTSHQKLLTVPCRIFNSTESCLENLSSIDTINATILVKGARAFRLERITQKLEKKVHGTVMEIDLGAIVHNLNVFRSRLNPTTKIMAMVKAFAYGSGSHEVASILQYHKVDYLGVAYADEGKALRNHGIRLPILVMNPTDESFQTLTEFGLEPSVYSKNILNTLIQRIGSQAISIHLKLDTGMHRLGFEESEMDEVIEMLKANPNVHVKSVYSHLAGSDAATHDGFSDEQAERFLKMSERICLALKISPIRHILNSSGISRLGKYQFDMVRLGIGMYGVDPGEALSRELKPATTLRSTISQIKTVREGETIGYGRHGKAKRPLRIATVAIGYADGYSRAFSKGVGKFWVNGKLAPVIGNVCMDMTMIDITDCSAAEGDTVTIFGDDLSVTEVASWMKTIPYELLTNTSDRVKRVFFAESI
jgi:alanine racemase